MNPTERARMMRSLRTLPKPVAVIPLRPDWTELTPKELLADLRRADAPPVLVDAMTDWHDAPERWEREPRHIPPHIDGWLTDRYRDRPQPVPARRRRARFGWPEVAILILALLAVYGAYHLMDAVLRAGGPA